MTAAAPACVVGRSGARASCKAKPTPPDGWRKALFDAAGVFWLHSKACGQVSPVRRPTKLSHVHWRLDTGSGQMRVQFIDRGPQTAPSRAPRPSPRRGFLHPRLLHFKNNFRASTCEAVSHGAPRVAGGRLCCRFSICGDSGYGPPKQPAGSACICILMQGSGPHVCAPACTRPSSMGVANGANH